MPISELKLYQKYIDNISGLMFQIVEIKIIGKTLSVRGRYFNQVTGTYLTIDIYDNQIS